MRTTAATFTRFSIAALAGALGLFGNCVIPLDANSTLISSAEARIGRPLTPLSYAGVARRTTRRAVAVGAAVAAPMVVAPATVCRQVVNSYGQIVTVCR